MNNFIKSTDTTSKVQYNIHDYDVPLTTVDIAIFAIIEHQLHVLMVERVDEPEVGYWALPGGFIDLSTDKNLEQTAHRKLKEKTGITSPYLEQVQSVGNDTRDPRGWSVTVLYFALVDFQQTVLNDDATAEHTRWVNVNKLASIRCAFDHQDLIQIALERLRNKTRYTSLPITLLPELFTLTELQLIFEILLGRTIEAKSFRRRLLEAGTVQATEFEKRSGKRNAQLFRASSISTSYEFSRAID